MSQPKRPTRKARPAWSKNAACNICGFPVSHRHHLLPFSKFGDFFADDAHAFAELCPNCHHMVHVIERIGESESARASINRVLNGVPRGRVNGVHLLYLCDLVRKSHERQIVVATRVLELIESGAAEPHRADEFESMRSSSRNAIAMANLVDEKLVEMGIVRPDPFARVFDMIVDEEATA